MAAISVAGFASCPFHQQALAAAKKLVDLGIYAELDDLTCATRDEYQVWLKSDKPSLEDARAATHTSSPFVFSGETFIGGCDDTLALLAESEAGRGSVPTRRLRAVAAALRSGAPPVRAEPTAAQPGTAEDEALVKAVLQDYIDGTFEGDVAKLKNCFHPDAIMNG
jgi:glutaredoxin